MKPIVLRNDLSRAAAKREIDAAPENYEATVLAPSKTRDQENAYHAIFDEVARQCTHLNQRFDREGWKRLLVDQFRTEALALPDLDQLIRDDLTGCVKMVPSLDGSSIVAIGLQTRKFKRKTAALLLEWLNAWCAQKDVRLAAPERMAA